MPIDPRDFRQHYGPWALIIGGSDGLGAALAAEIARTGINIILVARDPAKLAKMAKALSDAHGVKVSTASIDLELPGAAAQLAELSRDVPLGMVVFNAGADTSGAHFTDRPLDFWNGLIQRNVVTLTAALHHFSARFALAGRGGMIIVGSEAAFGGGARVGIYTATKGFALNFGESLWAELKPHGVDVLNLVFAIADTPTLRSVLAAQSIPIEAAGATDTTDLAGSALEHIRKGPTMVWLEDEESSDGLKSPSLRRMRCLTTTATMDAFYANDGA